jgi:HPr kinase/phosphorylase
LEQQPQQLTTNTVLSIAELVNLNPLDLVWAGGRSGGDRLLEPVTGTFPGTVMVGYLNTIHPHSIQVIGPTELAFLEGLEGGAQAAVVNDLFRNQRTSVVVVANGRTAPDNLIAAAERNNLPLLTSSESAPNLIAKLQNFLSNQMTPRTLLHGVMMAVYGLGVLITGSSGIGKSELGLELLSRNHRLVADDAVQIHRTPTDELIASCPENIHGHLEVRGLGILNIPEMFGYASVLDNRRLDLIVHLQRLRSSTESKLDRLQIQRAHQTVLGLERPRVSLIIAPGRNLAVLVEAAVRDCILRMRGRNPAAEFVERQQNSIKTPGDA